MKPIHSVDNVDLNRFMGDWYVLASISTFIEKDAFNAVESYRLDDDGTVATQLKFIKGSLDGPIPERPDGTIHLTKSDAESSSLISLRISLAGSPTLIWRM